MHGNQSTSIHIEEMEDEHYGENDLNFREPTVRNYLTAYDCSPPPLFIPIITILQVVVYLYYFLECESEAGAILAQIEGPLVYSPTRRYEIWRFLTVMFVHKDFLHLMSTVFLQVLFGTPLEMVHKFWRVATVYLFGVIIGSLAGSLFTNQITTGASGGCYAIVGANIAILITNWENMQKDWLKNITNFLCSGVSSLLILACSIGLEVWISFNTVAIGNHILETNFSGHIGGLITGILLGIPVLRNLNKKPWERICGFICVVLLSILVLQAVFYNIACESAGWCLKTDWS